VRAQGKLVGPQGCVASLAKIFGPVDEMSGMINSGRRRANFGAQLVHNKPQMRSCTATESCVNHSKLMKRGEYEARDSIAMAGRGFG
jgi:hypothetical protein